MSCNCNAKTPCTGGTQSGAAPCGCVAAAPGAPCANVAPMDRGVVPQGQLPTAMIGRYRAVSEGTKDPRTNRMGIGVATPKNERYAALMAANPVNQCDMALGAVQDGTVIQPPSPSNFPWLVAGSVLLMVGGLSAMFLATTPQQLGHGAKPARSNPTVIVRRYGRVIGYVYASSNGYEYEDRDGLIKGRASTVQKAKHELLSAMGAGALSNPLQVSYADYRAGVMNQLINRFSVGYDKAASLVNATAPDGSIWIKYAYNHSVTVSKAAKQLAAHVT